MMNHNLTAKNIAGIILIMLLLFLLFGSFLEGTYLGISTIFITIFFLILFMYQLGKGIPIKETVLLINAFQILFSTYIAYNYIKPGSVFSMHIEAYKYFSYAIPAILAFGMGLAMVGLNFDFDKYRTKIYQYNLGAVGKKLIIIGVSAYVFKSFSPRSLNFLMLLLSYFSYVGGLYIFFAKDAEKKYIWMTVAFFPLVISALSNAVFHWLLLWGIFFIMYAFYKLSPSLKKKIIIISAGFLFVFFLDTAKRHYRSIVWEQGKQMSSIEKIFLFTEYFFLYGVSDDDATDTKSLSARITRANQGAIITWVMDYVPHYEPFAKGETIKEAFESAFLPRILFPGKAKAGGQQKYTRFTGKALQGTSINIGLAGEAYANYGKDGVYFMLAMGLLYAFLMRQFLRICKPKPWLLLWFPFVFLVVIKAEDDLVTAINHISKSSILLFAFYHIYLKKVTKNIEQDREEESNSVLLPAETAGKEA